MLPSDARSVVRTLDRCRVRNWSIDRERRIDAATQLPRLARDALIWNVRLAVGTAESDLVGKGMLDAVAEGVGSPKRKIEYLNLSRGLHLQEIYDRSRTLLIHASHDIDGVSLKKLVRTAGFDTPSGVTHLFRRVHGMPPREVIDAGLDPSIWKLDEILEEVLSGRR
jgi:AraC-like DNA-binding protein